MHKYIKKPLDTLLQIKEIIFAVSVVIVAILNLWLGSKLSPVISDLNSLKGEVSADTRRIDNLEGVSNDTNVKVTQIVCYLLKEDCLKN